MRWRMDTACSILRPWVGSNISTSPYNIYMFITPVYLSYSWCAGEWTRLALYSGPGLAPISLLHPIIYRHVYNTSISVIFMMRWRMDTACSILRPWVGSNISTSPCNIYMFITPVYLSYSWYAGEWTQLALYSDPGLAPISPLHPIIYTCL